MRGKKGQMARLLVYHCIMMLTIAAIWAMIVKTLRGYDLNDVLTYVAAAFGSELLFLLLKRIFAKPKEKNSSQDEDGYA